MVRALELTGHKEEIMEQENLVEQPKTFDEMLENKEYQSEFDKRVQKAIATAKSKWDKEQLDVKDSKDNEAIAKLEEQIQKLNQTILDRDRQAEEKVKEEKLNKDINEVIKDKQFVNDFTKTAIINEIKNSLKTKDNANIKDLFDELVKDKEGIFVNPNAPKDIPNTNEEVFAEVDKESFNKMGYKERLILKQENPELYEQLTKK